MGVSANGAMSAGTFIFERAFNSRFFINESTGSHADTLHGLEKFAFGFDAGRDDDFRLLKFADGSGADVAHASGDGADKILRAVIDCGRAEKNLLQRTAQADL